MRLDEAYENYLYHFVKVRDLVNGISYRARAWDSIKVSRIRAKLTSLSWDLRGTNSQLKGTLASICGEYHG